MSKCYVSLKKKELLKNIQYLLEQDCCDEESCWHLYHDLQDLQHKCNDMFKHMHKTNEKGNIEGTACEDLQNKKRKISSKEDAFSHKSVSRSRRSRQGGRKNKRKSRYYSRKIGPKT